MKETACILLQTLSDFGETWSSTAGSGQDEDTADEDLDDIDSVAITSEDVDNAVIITGEDIASYTSNTDADTSSDIITSECIDSEVIITGEDIASYSPTNDVIITGEDIASYNPNNDVIITGEDIASYTPTNNVIITGEDIAGYTPTSDAETKNDTVDLTVTDSNSCLSEDLDCFFPLSQVFHLYFKYVYLLFRIIKTFVSSLYKTNYSCLIVKR